MKKLLEKYRLKKMRAELVKTIRHEAYLRDLANYYGDEAARLRRQVIPALERDLTKAELHQMLDDGGFV